MRGYAVLALGVLLILALCAVAAGNVVTGSDAQDSTSLYYISTMIPGEGSTPPQLVISHSRGTGALELRFLSSNWADRAAQSVASFFGVIRDRVPLERHDLCHFNLAPEAFSVHASLAEPEEATVVTCNEELFAHFSLGKFLSVREFHQSLPAGRRLPLSVEVNGECTRIPFSLSALDVYAISDESMVVVLELWDESRHVEESRCSAWFEVRRDVTDENSEPTRYKSFVGPVAMLALVIALRTLPRYILTRRGQLDRDSYKGTVPKLSPARLAELKSQQRAIIAQMKEEDARNGLLKKTQ